MSLDLAELIIFLKGKFSLWIKTFFFLFLVFSSCEKSKSKESESAPPEFIPARDKDISLNRPLIYRAVTLDGWTRLEPDPMVSIADTTLANCEFVLENEEGKIRLTVHTFPFEKRNLRIPPQAQIARWKQQFDEIDPLAVHIDEESRGGFSGLFFEAEGIIKEQPTMVMGWSMQIAEIFDRVLEQEKDPLDIWKRADYTIKATGPIQSMRAYRKDIIRFSNSFELIDELRISG